MANIYRMLYLTESDVLRLLPMSECLPLMRTVFERLASGEAINQPRRRLTLPTKSTLHYMARIRRSIFRQRRSTRRILDTSHTSCFFFIGGRTRSCLRSLRRITWARSAQARASGHATRLLARPDSRTLGVIGSGFQAERRWTRSKLPCQGLTGSGCGAGRPRNARLLPENAGRKPAATAEEAVRGADIVVTATSSGTPVIESAWVAAGAHINAMGSNQPRRRELPAELVLRADLIAADSIEQSRIESGDLLSAFTSEDDWGRVVELSDVTVGRSGRKRPTDITVFKSNGLAVEDVIAAGWVFERARQSGAGRPFYS